MNLREYLTEAKEDKYVIGVVPYADTGIPYLKKVGRRAVRTKTFEEFNPEKNYKLGNTSYNAVGGEKQTPQSTWLKVYVPKEEAGSKEVKSFDPSAKSSWSKANKVAIKEFEDIEKIEVLTRGGWKNVPLPEKDADFKGHETEENMKAASAKEVYARRRK